MNIYDLDVTFDEFKIQLANELTNEFNNPYNTASGFIKIVHDKIDELKTGIENYIEDMTEEICRRNNGDW